ncbi:MAG: DUF3187 family protein [Planctomycetota bacterium]|jgi:hypothetical protein|nr:DUF3187 family protein [Planctomycetota bacterium]
MNKMACRGLMTFALFALVTQGIHAQASTKDRLLEPFRYGGNDVFNIMTLIPKMESAITMGKGEFRTKFSIEFVENSATDQTANSQIDITGGATEFNTFFAFGLADFLDLQVDIPLTSIGGSLLSVVDGESLFALQQGINTITVDNELGDPVVSTKFQLWGGEQAGSGLALRLQLKLPLGDERDLHSSGGLDIGFGILSTTELDWGIWHFNLDYTHIGSVSAFRPEARIELEDTLSVGVGYLFEVIEDDLAIGAQLFGYLNPYRATESDLEGMDSIPASFLLGTRWIPGDNLSLELGAGPGITKDAAAFTLFLGFSFQL